MDTKVEIIITGPVKFVMSLCYASQAYKGEIGRLKASFLLGFFFSLIILLGIVGFANAMRVHIPIILLIFIVIGDFYLGDRLGAVCFNKVSFREIKAQSLLKVSIVVSWYCIMVFLLAISFMSVMYNVLRY